jgi:hypothetical protein
VESSLARSRLVPLLNEGMSEGPVRTLDKRASSTLYAGTDNYKSKYLLNLRPSRLSVLRIYCSMTMTVGVVTAGL